MNCPNCIETLGHTISCKACALAALELARKPYEEVQRRRAPTDDWLDIGSKNHANRNT